MLHKRNTVGLGLFKRLFRFREASKELRELREEGGKGRTRENIGNREGTNLKLTGQKRVKH